MVASLTCRKSGSCSSRPEEQGDERARAHAADADDLARHVDQLELLEQVAAVRLQARAVGPELFVDDVVDLVGGDAVRLEQLARGDDDGRLADDTVVAVGVLGELGERLQAVARASLVGGPLDALLPCQLQRLKLLCRPRLLLGLLRLPTLLRRRLLRDGGGFGRHGAHGGQHLLLVEVGVPDVHDPHLREPRHGLAVGAHDGACGGALVLLAETVVTRRDREARGHASHVVLERAGQRLVEVVEVEDELALR